MTLDSRLKEIKERCEAATEGPWKNEDNAWDGNSNVIVWDSEFDPIIYVNSGFGFQRKDPIEHKGNWNSRFIAHARTDVPMLLEMVEHIIKSYCYCDDEQCDTCFRVEKIAEKYNG
jgi:hypothetical protein